MRRSGGGGGRPSTDGPGGGKYLGSLRKRRALALISMMEIADESSIRMGADAKRPEGGGILFFQSAYWRKPRLILDESMRASPASMRSINSYFDISSEKSKHGMLCCSAACMATFTAQEVLPPPGRAATMIRFSRCRPAVSSSSLENPVGTPVTDFLSEVRTSRLCSTSSIRSPVAE